MAGETLHEERSLLSKEILDRHRALSTIMEELEAIDWYDQRIAASDNADLRAVLTHNRDEEKEHASMLLEWLRRHDPAFDRHLKAQLFNPGAIQETEKLEASAAAEAPAANGSLAIGSLAIGSLGIGSLRGGAEP